jgi:uncharacterized protein (TIGR02186 family)
MHFNQKKFILFIIFFYFVIPETLQAEKAYFDLSDETIKIQTNFKGKEVIIFGLADPSYDTILIIKGPDKNFKLAIKERLFGIWIETKKFTFENIPSVFFVASSSEISKILDENIIRQKGLNFNNFNKNSFKNISSKDTKIFENNLYEWDRNFIRKQKENNFYKEYILEIVDKKLFHTRVFFPPNTVPGNYDVSIYQVKNNKIINESKKLISIRKTGIGNIIYQFAQKKPSVYGILCIIFAVVSGIAASTAFRRL